MTQFHHPVNEEKSYRRALFAFAALALAGCCSIYPVMCFKNYSSKEKERLNRKVAKVERKAEEGEEWLRSHRPRTRHHSHSPHKTARLPDHHHHRRRHSSVHHGHRHRQGRYEEDDLEMESVYGNYPLSSSHAYDRQLDGDRRRRHHGHPPPRRYHHSS